jgi:hypothetical protein
MTSAERAAIGGDRYYSAIANTSLVLLTPAGPSPAETPGYAPISLATRSRCQVASPKATSLALPRFR